MDLPYLSLCMPIYNRNKFTRLIISNLMRLDYPKEKIEFVIDDDGVHEKFINEDNTLENMKKVLYPMEFSYNHYKTKRSIGDKRNNLVKIAKHKIIGFMDSDDLYLSDYLKYSVNMLKTEKKGLVGSNQMLFLFPPENFEDKWLLTGIKCSTTRMIHEASMVFTKKHFKAMGGFIKSSHGEGTGMIDGMNPKTIGLTDIHRIMVCICHEGNTIDKTRFKESQVLEGEVDDFDKAMIHRILYPE
tara:strand:+ start:703 stop:1431 length:729 start_codon:yes stop_codon:yes gene_type:complete